MRVQRLRMPVTDAESWTVLDDDWRPEPAIEQYLAHLAALERSPNTVRAYATSLKLWFEFLAQVDVGWAEAGVDDVARFVSWLRAPASKVIIDLRDEARLRAQLERSLGEQRVMKPTNGPTATIPTVGDMSPTQTS